MMCEFALFGDTLKSCLSSYNVLPQVFVVAAAADADAAVNN
jgi:hypothetical protein